MKLKVLAFDGEMLPLANGKFPTADKSPITLLSFAGNYEILNGKKKVIFILNRDRNMPDGIDVREDHVRVRFNDERMIPQAWAKLVRGCDVATGYNSSGFDIPYIIDRGKVIGSGKLVIGNTEDVVFVPKNHISKGMTVNTIGNAKGKIVEDVLYVLRRGDASNTIKADYTLKNLKLEVTSKEVLGHEKKEFSIKEMTDYWEKGVGEEKFIEYCSVDSELALEFITKFRLLDKFIGLSRRAGKITQDIIDSQGFGSLVENLLLKEFKKLDRVVPCRGKSHSGLGEIEDELEGAFVLPPKVGISNCVVIADYASLYPSLIIKNNICYTTVILDKSIPDDPETMNIIRNEDGILLGRFVKPHILKGIVPTILENLMSERKTAKAEMKKHEKGSIDYLMWDSIQNAVKILMNSFYGFTGEQGAKLYYHDIAASVTGSGQKQIKYTMKQIDGKIITDIDGRQYKLVIIMGDTDSIYVNVIPVLPEHQFNPTETLKNREICVRVVTKELDAINVTLEKPMKLAFEDYAERVLVTAKKRYSKIIVDGKGKKSLSSKGIETQRRDWCNFATENLNEAYKIILYESDIVTGTNKMVDFIRNEAEKLKDGKIEIEKLSLSKSLTKLITEYDNKAVHVQVAIKMKERGKPSNVGDRIPYLIMDIGNPKALIGEKAEEFEYVKAGNCKHKIDYDYYINKQLYPPIVRILTAIGEDKNLLYKNKDQKSLLEF
jgi:DNA polymerase I